MKKAVTAIAFYLTGLLTSVSAHPPHIHGIATLNLLVEGPLVEIELISPLANHLSFEHKPENDEQIKEVQKMVKILNEGEKLFYFPQEAQCRMTKTVLESALLDGILSSSKTDSGTEQSDRKDPVHSHADLEAFYSFECARTDALNGFEVRLFKDFEHLQSINVQMVTPVQQKAFKLDASSNRVTW